MSGALTPFERGHSYGGEIGSHGKKIVTPTGHVRVPSVELYAQNILCQTHRVMII